MPNRVLKDTIWKSKSLALLKPYFQDQWPRWLLMSDDWGCFDADCEIIKGIVYPKRKETQKTIKSIKSAYVNAGQLLIWEEEDREWGFFVKWDSHQYIGSLQYNDKGERERHRRKTPEPPKSLLDSYLLRYGAVRNITEQDGTKVLIPSPNPIPNPSPSTTLVEVVLQAWNKTTPFKVTTLSETRRKHLVARLKEEAFRTNYPKIFATIASNDFLSGRKPSATHPNFKATFDWVVGSDTNYVKILEGRYASESKVSREAAIGLPQSIKDIMGSKEYQEIKNEK